MNRAWWAAPAMLAMLSGPAGAETLADAVRAAATNPVLAAARARQTARTELTEQARSLGRLTADLGGGGSYDRFDRGRGANVVASADLPIWTGGRVESAVRAARADVAAGERELRDAEAAVLADVVAAYADLLLQQQAVAIATAQIALLDAQVSEAEARFRLGTGTQTDVMQLTAQGDAARAGAAAARAALAGAAAAYRAVVGRDPGTLVLPDAPLPRLPDGLDAARTQAVAANPLLAAARETATAAAARVAQARAEGRPTIGLGASYGYGYAFGAGTGGAGVGGAGGYTRTASAGLSFRVPVLTGGLVASRVREANALSRAAGLDRDAAAREAVRAAESAWANLEAARARVEAGTRAVAAATRALDGVKAEYSLGLRSTLDILIADQSLRSAQLSLAAARSDALTGQAALLRATGGLSEEAFAASAIVAA